MCCILLDSYLFQVMHVHPSSVMFTRTPSTGYVIFHDVVETTKTFIRDLTVIDSDWYVSSPMLLPSPCYILTDSVVQARRTLQRVLQHVLSDEDDISVLQPDSLKRNPVPLRCHGVDRQSEIHSNLQHATRQTSRGIRVRHPGLHPEALASRLLVGTSLRPDLYTPCCGWSATNRTLGAR